MIHHQDWNLEKISGKLAIKYKKTAGSELISIKFEGELDIPLFGYLTMIYETELFPKWVPFCNKSDMLKQVHRGIKICNIHFGLPPPVTDREMLCCGIGIDRIEINGSIFVLVKTVDTDEHFQKTYDFEVPEEKRYVRVDVPYLCFELTPLTKDKIYIRAIANTDPKCRFIPNFLISWFLRKFASMGVNIMFKHARNFEGSEWEKLMQRPDKKDFYDWLRPKVEEYLAKRLALEEKKAQEEKEQKEKEKLKADPKSKGKGPEESKTDSQSMKNFISSNSLLRAAFGSNI
eukprot:TRINITY_DN3006_c0_g1_i9.p1 TRINITY_DN3006_c0_g1~~TRINITY_DN3006_c0_g1_i9.p1  ORF type:complete len:289 (-),score=37.71 TRINITY_DN3006_c0_g1_i9:341-1207(-)